jgi:hypothetical protein
VTHSVLHTSAEFLAKTMRNSISAEFRGDPLHRTTLRRPG